MTTRALTSLVEAGRGLHKALEAMHSGQPSSPFVGACSRPGRTCLLPGMALLLSLGLAALPGVRIEGRGGYVVAEEPLRDAAIMTS